MLRHIRPALVLLVAFSLLTGLAYPLAITGIAQLVFPKQANGSLIERNGAIVGSELIGQSFASDRYFHGRPSATVDTDPNDSSKTVSSPYNAANSSGSNLGPDQQGADRSRRGRRRAAAAPRAVADPRRPGHHVRQRPRSAHLARRGGVPDRPRRPRSRPFPEQRVRDLVADATEHRPLGILGEPRVNVLRLNLALDSLPTR